MSLLLSPVQIGAFKLRNRIVMAPLTRNRADLPGRVPNRMMADYYAQRASAGMIMTEATSVTPMGVGYPQTPGIWSQAQVAGWRHVTDAVHKAGGLVLMQLWHVGRISDPMYLDGKMPVAPSAIAPKGHVSLTRPQRPYVVPRALETEEVVVAVEAYRKGAANAKAAGFDGVEIHGANGYLIDQFLQDSTNTRTDRYGGSLENRARFMLEIVDAVISVWGSDRVGMHLAPRADAHDMGDSNRAETFGHVAAELGKRRLAFLCAREAQGPDSLGPRLKKAFGGAYIVNERFKAETAEKAIRDGEADAVAFGKAFIANPDLVRRIAEGAPLNAWDVATFYSEGPKGYVDYPALP